MIAVAHWRSFSKIKTFGWSVALSKWLWAWSRVAVCVLTTLAGARHANNLGSVAQTPIRFDCIQVCVLALYLLLLSNELCSYIYMAQRSPLTSECIHLFCIYFSFSIKKQKKGSIVQPHTRRYFFFHHVHLLFQTLGSRVDTRTLARTRAHTENSFNVMFTLYSI